MNLIVINTVQKNQNKNSWYVSLKLNKLTTPRIRTNMQIPFGSSHTRMTQCNNLKLHPAIFTMTL